VYECPVDVPEPKHVDTDPVDPLSPALRAQPLAFTTSASASDAGAWRLVNTNPDPFKPGGKFFMR
jgi:hypothetical protein